MIACCLSDEITVGGQEGYWLSVDYVLAHGQPWLSHRAHCPPTKKMRVSERESQREKERGRERERPCPGNTIPPPAGIIVGSEIDRIGV